MTTTKSELRLAISAILQGYDIDDLQIEIDLTAKAIEILGLSTDEEVKRVGAAEALARHEKRAEKRTLDVSYFPEDVRDTVFNVCQLWYLRPPTKIGGKEGEYAHWIKCARGLQDACGEFEEMNVLLPINEDYEQKKKDAYGIVPYTVSGPCSLIKMCRAKTAEIRERKARDDGSNTGDKEDRLSSFHI